MANGTIAAIATALGEASIGMVRLSGPQAVAIADRLFRGAAGGRLADAPSLTVSYGWVVDPASGVEVDEVLATVMRAPRSYTREEVVELSGHGGVVGVRRILELVLAAGARLAEPGEFTQRAFLNGRIDLAQAEAVLQLIRATHEAARAATLQALRGGLSTTLGGLRRRLLSLQASLEVSVDFPGDDQAPRSSEQLQDDLTAIAHEMRGLADATERGQALAAGSLTVICGRPNVGKSSLLNALLRRDRAIVTAIPGTTRDTIEELLILDGLPVRLVDTAGLGPPGDLVEAAGIQRTQEALRQADAALWVLDRSVPWQPEDLAVARAVPDRRTVIALNKADLPARLAPDQLHTVLPGAPVVEISATQHQGIERLERQLTGLLRDRPPTDPQGPWVATARQREALRQAQAAVGRAGAALAAQGSPELVAVEVREALDQLGAITGETASDELLATIFSQFCIGK